METMEIQLETDAMVSDMSCGLVRDDSGPVVEDDPAAIMDGLRQELDRLRLTHDSSCICVIGPDGADGAQAMDGLGERMASSLRSYDAIYRFADDKYLVMLPHVGRGDAVSVIKRLRARVISKPFPAKGDDGKVMITASFGGTILDSKAPLHEHMDRASEAYDWALKGMGDSICIWTPQL